MKNIQYILGAVLISFALSSCENKQCEGCETWEIISNERVSTCGVLSADVVFSDESERERIYYHNNDELSDLVEGDSYSHHKHYDNFCGVVIRLGEDWVLVRNESNLNEKSFHGIPKEIMNDIVKWDRFCGSTQW